MRRVATGVTVRRVATRVRARQLGATVRRVLTTTAAVREACRALYRNQFSATLKVFCVLQVICNSVYSRVP